MSISISDITGANDVRVTSQQRGLHVSMRPIDVNSWNSLGTQTGLTTTLAAGAPIFSLRNISANNLVVRNLGIGCIATTAFTTAQRVEYAAFVARNFTASDTGGTTIAITGNNTKHKTAFAGISSVDARVSAAAALTAGARTLDANPLALVGAHIGAVGAGIPVSKDNLLAQSTGDYPVILAQNEGLVITNNFLMGAAGVVLVYINIEFAEIVAGSL